MICNGKNVLLYTCIFSNISLSSVCDYLQQKNSYHHCVKFFLNSDPSSLSFPSADTCPHFLHFPCPAATKLPRPAPKVPSMSLRRRKNLLVQLLKSIKSVWRRKNFLVQLLKVHQCLFGEETSMPLRPSGNMCPHTFAYLSLLIDGLI